MISPRLGRGRFVYRTPLLLFALPRWLVLACPTLALCAGLLLAQSAGQHASAAEPLIGGGRAVLPGVQLQQDVQNDTDTELLILHFWASWCIPCRAEMQDMAEFHQQYVSELAPAGVRLLTISNDLRDDDLQTFMQQVPVLFPVYFDPLAVLQDRYRVPALPATVVVDRDGNIQHRWLGSQNWNTPEFVEQIRHHLQAQTAATTTTTTKD